MKLWKNLENQAHAVCILGIPNSTETVDVELGFTETLHMCIDPIEKLNEN